MIKKYWKLMKIKNSTVFRNLKIWLLICRISTKKLHHWYWIRLWIRCAKENIENILQREQKKKILKKRIFVRLKRFFFKFSYFHKLFWEKQNFVHAYTIVKIKCKKPEVSRWSQWRGVLFTDGQSGVLF
jgi:hypothetical protein